MRKGLRPAASPSSRSLSLNTHAAAVSSSTSPLPLFARYWRTWWIAASLRITGGSRRTASARGTLSAGCSAPRWFITRT